MTTTLMISERRVQITIVFQIRRTEQQNGYLRIWTNMKQKLCEQYVHCKANQQHLLIQYTNIYRLGEQCIEACAAVRQTLLLGCLKLFLGCAVPFCCFDRRILIHD